MEDFRSGDALFTCNGELEIVQWNQAAEELTGISSTEAVGRRCWHVLCGVGDTGQTILDASQLGDPDRIMRKAQSAEYCPSNSI